MSSVLRLALSAACLSAWLVLLLAGHSFGGAVYLLLLAAPLVFPWRAARAGERTSPEETP